MSEEKGITRQDLIDLGLDPDKVEVTRSETISLSSYPGHYVGHIQGDSLYLLGKREQTVLIEEGDHLEVKVIDGKVYVEDLKEKG